MPGTRLKSKFFFALFCLVTLNQCLVTGLPQFNAQNQGLLVVSITLNPLQELSEYNRNIEYLMVDGRRQLAHTGANAVLPLSVGEHTLDGFIQENKQYKLLTAPKFTIRRGEITNLGHILFISEMLLRDPRKLLERFKNKELTEQDINHLLNMEKSYRIAYLDNNQDVKQSFSYDNPLLYSQLNNKQPQLHPNRYAKSRQLKILRRLVFRVLHRGNKGNPGHYLFGPFGIAAYFKEGKINSSFELIKTGTLRDLSRCMPQANNYICILNNARWLRFAKGKLSSHPFPKGFAINTVFNDRENLYIVTQHNRVLKYQSDNRWKMLYEGKGDVLVKGKNSFAYQRTASGGIVIYSKDLPHEHSILLYRPPGQKFRPINLQPSVQNITQVLQTRSSLLILTAGDGPANQFSSIHTFQHTSGKWKKKKLAYGKCKLEKLKRQRLEYIAYCHNKNWSSYDNGISWQLNK